MQRGTNGKIGNYVTIADDAAPGNNVTIGNHVTIYPKATIADNCIVMDGDPGRSRVDGDGRGPAKPLREVPAEWREKILEYGREQDKGS
ncbi:MAG: hypothetical protein HFACDABA_01656 [Anaerolineales bacterium]|nr:hypothetical protein [Anaerolineales bacterium]